MEAVYRKRKKRGSLFSFTVLVKKKTVIKAIIILSVIGFTFVGLISYLDNSVFSAMTTLAEAKVNAAAIQAMNDSILTSLSEGVDYATFTEAITNDQKIYMVTANPNALNQLAATCANLAQEKLSEKSKIGIKIPLGTLSGIAIFSGRGPDITIKFNPASSVKARFTSELTSSGINQSLYRVKIILSSKMYIVMPAHSKNVDVSCEAVIAENVIIGDVPQVYTNVPKDDLTNLVPTQLP